MREVDIKSSVGNIFCFIIYFYRLGKGRRKRGRETSIWERNIDRLPPVRTLTRDWTHNPGMCPGETPESTITTTTTAKALPVGVHRPFILPLPTPGLLLPGGSFVRCENWTESSLRHSSSNYEILSLLILKGSMYRIYTLQQNVHLHSLSGLMYETTHFGSSNTTVRHQNTPNSPK